MSTKRNAWMWCDLPGRRPEHQRYLQVGRIEGDESDDEWQDYISGKARRTVFGPETNSRPVWKHAQPVLYDRSFDPADRDFRRPAESVGHPPRHRRADSSTLTHQSTIQHG